MKLTGAIFSITFLSIFDLGIIHQSTMFWGEMLFNNKFGFEKIWGGPPLKLYLTDFHHNFGLKIVN